jgi:hypothetical protein
MTAQYKQNSHKRWELLSSNLTLVRNPFDAGGYSLAEMTQAINILPNLYTRLGQMGLFRFEGVNKRSVIIEQYAGVLNLLPSVPLGGPATVGNREGRSMRSFVRLRAPGPRDATPFYEARPRIAGLVWGVFALLGEFAFAEGAVGDLAQHANRVAQVANITALDLIRAAIEMVVAQGGQPRQHRVDLSFGSDEGSAGLGGSLKCGGHSVVASSEPHRFDTIRIAPVRSVINLIHCNIVALIEADSAMEGMSESADAANSRLSRGAVQKARKSGRLVLYPDGSINAAASDGRRSATTDPDPATARPI